MANIIRKGDKAHAPMHWSRRRGEGWRLPTLWDVRGKSCFITMDMLPEFEDDVTVFPLEAVAETVLSIINWCQTSPRLPHLGGRETVGPEGKAIVILAGKVPETGPKPPGFREIRTWARPLNSSHDTS